MCFPLFHSGMFFDKHLRYIKLNEQMVEFTKMNLTHLLKVIFYSQSHIKYDFQLKWYSSSLFFCFLFCIIFRVKFSTAKLRQAIFEPSLFVSSGDVWGDTTWLGVGKGTGSDSIQYQRSIQANSQVAWFNGWFQGKVSRAIVHRSTIGTHTPKRTTFDLNHFLNILYFHFLFQSGVPRTGYLGIVSFYYNNQRVYLAPSNNWRGYDLSWS